MTTDTFWEYLQNVKSVNQVILLLILLGAGIAFWLGKDAGIGWRSRREQPSGTPAAEPRPQPEQGEKV